MTVTEQKVMTYNGRQYTADEIQTLMARMKILQGVYKEAKKKGLITEKAVAEKKEKSAIFNLMLAQFAPVMEANKVIVADLFKEFDGQDSISFDINKDYHIIIRSKAVVKAKQEARKVAVKAEAEAEVKAEMQAKEAGK